MEAHGAITVRVSPVPSTAPTYALAWTSENGGKPESAGLQQVGVDGIASFLLRLDRRYAVGAFTDENGNRAYDVGELADYVRDVKPVSLSDPNVQPKILKLSLRPRHGLPAGFTGTTVVIPKENKELGGELKLALGEVVSLDDKRFATDVGGGGVWRPLDFLSNNHSGIYFTEPYDPKRIPVLLVYGIGGTPQDWRYFIYQFDHKHYQLWFFHYPSGARLGRLSHAMAAGLNLVRQRYGFKQCDVVAHSMGGLVAAAGITEAVRTAGVNFIPKFVSISTPWAGHDAAQAGIRRLKKPVPSWLDVAPNSEFLERIYLSRLPGGTRHLLIYGSKPGGPFWLKGENDRVVTVESETDPRIKNHAARVIHLPYEHVEILSEQKTLTETLRFLNSGS
jgi:hypothetical protein